MTYSFKQLEQLWEQAGGNPAAAPIAAAIALAESGGNPNAVDYDSNGTVDRGLWQINSVHGSQSTFNVEDNAKSAVAISNNGSDWKPWVTFQTGAYKKYLDGNPGTIPSSGGSSGGGSSDGSASLTSAISSIGNQIQGIEQGVATFVQDLQWITNPTNWVRIFAGIFGFLFLISGLVFLAKAV